MIPRSPVSKVGGGRGSIFGFDFLIFFSKKKKSIYRLYLHDGRINEYCMYLFEALTGRSRALGPLRSREVDEVKLRSPNLHVVRIHLFFRFI